jgi:penicillin amidase
MKLISVLFRLCFALIAIAIVAAMLLVPRMNDIQRNGSAPLAQLTEPVSVVRDDKGMAYVRAASLLDVVRAQGYVTAQDRLFQLMLTRIAVSGRLAELFGDALLDRDKRQRTLGFYRAAERHESLLNERDRAMFQAYADGVNAFINNPDASVPLELKLAGVAAEPWRVVDSLAVLYFMGWGSASDLKSELITQAIIDKVGIDRFREVAPLNYFPGDQRSASVAKPAVTQVAQAEAAIRSTRQSTVQSTIQPTAQLSVQNHTTSTLAIQTLQAFMCCDAGAPALGSNNWVLSSDRSPGGKPILVNDPHLETTLLPTTFYPIGLFTPDLRAVGVNVPGLPGIIIGRNQYVATGVTNGYADAQDVSIETVDPNNPANYLEGQTSVPFELIEESIKVKDDTHESGYRQENFTVRLTRRGPVVSDLNDSDVPSEEGKVLSVRWAPFETMLPSTGLDALLRSRSLDEARRALANVTTVHLNFVVADTQGNIGWQVTGAIPYRRNNDGGVPVQVTDDQDNWTGWVPFPERPGILNPPQGWVGTANHRTVPDSNPYFYSSYFSPDYRIRRMFELFEGDDTVTTEQHWQHMRDDLNLLARDVVPLMVSALQAQEPTAALASVLGAWDFHDDADSAAPLIFQEVWRRMVDETLTDELGPDITAAINKVPYYWSQRMHQWVLDGTSSWFDRTDTDVIETRDDIIRSAATDAMQSIEAQLGNDISAWRWGDLHQIEFLNPLRRSGVGKGLLGGGSYPMNGSGHTLYRAGFDLSETGNNVVYSAALRMVVDLSDDDKVMAVVPGGVSGRLYTPNFVDQVDEYISGEPVYWWYSDELIDEYGVSELVLLP